MNFTTILLLAYLFMSCFIVIKAFIEDIQKIVKQIKEKKAKKKTKNENI